MNWYIEVIAAKLAALAQGKIQQLIINLPPRHLNPCWPRSRFPLGVLGTTLGPDAVRQLYPGSRRLPLQAVAENIHWQ
jgi:hypothetical protein